MRNFIQYFLLCVEFFFVLYMVGYATFLFLSVTVGSSELYAAKRRSRLKNELDNDYFLPVSVIVPAHNEGITIESTVRSLLGLSYRIYEIIIVDDGSTDDTAQVMREKFNMVRIDRPVQRRIACQPELAIYESREWKVPIILVSKQNGGKADALNMGINISTYPYFLCIDADSVLQYDSLDRIVRPILEDSSTVAVGGAVRPCNGATIENGHVIQYNMPKNILASMQVLEYERSFLASRIFFDKFNGNIIISGAFGLFRKDLVVAAGGYDHDTMGEDMELVVKLHVFCRETGKPYRIRYAPDAICWTQVPENMKDLCKQRRRWHIGLFQCMRKYRNILANPKYGLVSFVSYFYFLFYELLSPFIEVFGVFATILAFCVDLINMPFLILFFAIYVVYAATLSLTAFFARTHTVDLRLRFSDVVKAVELCALEVSCLRFIMAWVRMTALIGYNKKRHVWGHIERKTIDIK